MYDEDFLKETLKQAFIDSDKYYVPIGIRRQDHMGMHGWWVRVTRDKVMFRKLFSDGVCGSIEESFKEAILYRHEVLSKIPITIKMHSGRVLDNNPEKRIKRHVEKRVNRPHVFWKARWYDENHKVKTERFSVLEHGEERAEKLAFDAAKKRHSGKPILRNITDLYLKQKFVERSRSTIQSASRIKSSSSNSKASSSEEIIKNDSFTFEGEKKFILHKVIERDRTFRSKKIKDFINKNGKIYCEVCSFNFMKNYPFLNVDIIEVHHVIPLSTLTKKTKIELKDLVLLCSNCHFAVHQGDAEENLILAWDEYKNR